MSRAPVLTRDGAWIADDWSVIRDPAAVVNESEAALLPLPCIWRNRHRPHTVYGCRRPMIRPRSFPTWMRCR